MIDSRASKLVGAVLAAALLLAGYPGRSLADPAADAAAMQEQMRQMQQRLDELNRQLQALKQQQQQTTAAPAAPAAPAVAQAKPAAPAEPTLTHRRCHRTHYRPAPGTRAGSTHSDRSHSG